MPALPDDERKQVAQQWAKKAFANKTADLTGQDLLSAVGAIDDKIVIDEVGWIASIPEPMQSKTTLEEKSLLIKMVLDRRVDE